MKLTASLTLALVSAQNVSAATPAAGGLASATMGAHALQRMLARKEDRGRIQEGRNLAKGDPKKTTTKKTISKGKEEEGDKDKDKDKKGTGGRITNSDKEGKKAKKEKKEKNKKLAQYGDAPRKGKDKHKDKAHSAAMDKNEESGVYTDEVEYDYEDEVYVSFKLTNDLVAEEVLETMDVSKMSDWTLGVFMRMADPQGGSLKPIMAMQPTFTSVGRRSLQSGFQSIQGQEILMGQGQELMETTNTTETDPSDDVDDVDDKPIEIPDLDEMGYATFTNTSAAALDEGEYGTGFDIFLLNEDGAKIIGPATFYMIKSPKAVAEEMAKAMKGPKTGLAKHDHGKKKHKVITAVPAAQAKGTVLVIEEVPALAGYNLLTDYQVYDLGDNITVTYDLNPEVTAEAPVAMTVLMRKLKIKGEESSNLQTKGEGSRNLKKKKKDATTTTTVAPPPADVTTDATTTTVPSPPTDEEDVPGPTSTTEAPPPEDVEGEEVGEALEVQPDETVDPTDITKYRVGLYMRMANPDRGALKPLFEMPFCEAPCATALEDLTAGTFTFNVDDLDVKENGSGFDVWILDGAGVGMAGPATFYITIPVEEGVAFSETTVF